MVAALIRFATLARSTKGAPVTLQADLEILGKLGATLHDLATRAGQAKPEHPANPPQSLLCVPAADQLEKDLLVGTLVPAVKARLDETADVMTTLARHFEDADDRNADRIVDWYRQCVGDWNS